MARFAYPLLLDLTDRLAVIVGGGAVALRKARGLLAAGGRRIRCIAPQIDPQMPAEVEAIREPFRSDHLDGATLAFAATDRPEVNEAVVREARRRGILVSRADADEEAAGDFSTPALFRAGAVMVTVSAGGSPALAAAIRDDLESRIDPGQVKMAAAMEKLRPLIRSRMDETRRREVFRALAGREAIAELSAGGVPALARWLESRWTELEGLADADH